MASADYDLASRRYEFSLKCRIFRKWKHLYFDADVKPIKEVLIVVACFKWMCTSLGDYKSSSFFPEYAAVEPDGNSSNYFKDRLRLYMKDKLHFPARNFPLLIHAIALFDAHQLVHTFKAWREQVQFCKKLDLFAKQLRIRRCFLKLQRFNYAQQLLKYKYKRIFTKHKIRVQKNCLVVWHIQYKSLAFQRLRTVPRRKANILFTLRIALNLNKYERFSIQNGIRFYLKRRLIRSYRLWFQKLSHSPSLDAFHSNVLLKQLLLEIIFRHHLVSLSYNKLVRQVASSRSHFFRNHRLVFYVVRSIYDSLPASVMEMFARVKNAWVDDDIVSNDLSQRYSTPLHHTARHNSQNGMSLFQASLQRPQTPTSPESDQEYPSPIMSPYSPRSVFETPVHDRDDRLRLSDLSSEKKQIQKQKVRVVLAADRPEVSGAASLGHIACMHNQIYCSSMKLLHQNLSSRQSQLLQLRIASHFLRYRSMAVSLRRWMGWVPQSKLNRMDSLSAPLFYSPKTSDDRFSVPGDGHVYVYFKSLQHRFRQWRWTARRKVFLRQRSRFIKRRVQLAVQSRLLGSWLICTARYEQYRRVENRVLNTRLSKQLYLSFYAWRVLLQRIQLLRNNEKQRVIDRNNSIRQFVDQKFKSDATRSQSTILRTWSLHIRNLKRGRMLVAKWTKTAGTRFLFLALHRWRLVCHLDLIVTCFKKIWLGFKVRRITHGGEYDYMRWFQPQIRKYQYFRSHYCKQLIFGILRRFVSELRASRHDEVSHVHFRRAVRMMRRFKSKIKARRRLASRATVGRGLRCNKTVFVRLKEMLLKGRSLRLHTANSQHVALKKTLLRLLSTATLSTQLRAVALKSDRRLATYAFQQFRSFHRHIILRSKLNARRVDGHLLRFHFRKLVAFGRRRQRVYVFQDAQQAKKARGLLVFWRSLVDTRNYYHRVSREHFRRFKQRSYLRSWLKVTRRRLYGQVEPGSAFQVSARRRMLQRLEKARLCKAFGRFRRFVYSYRKQRLNARYIVTSRNSRLVARAYQKLKYHWFKKHRSLHGHRLKDISTSVRRGLLHEALYKLMTLNLTRNHSDNLRHRAMQKWLAKSRTRSRALRVDSKCVKQYHRTVLKQFLRRLLKNVIKQKKKRHAVGLQRREIRKHSLRLVLHKMQSIHRKRVVHYNALKRFRQERMVYLCARLLYRMRVAVRYRAKLLRFRFVKRLKQMGRIFFGRLRYFVTRTKRSPARQALIRIGRKKRRLAFKRFKLRCVRVITSRLIQEHALQHHLRRKALKCLRFWRRYLFLKKRLHAIRRKFLMVPRFRAWHQLAVEQIHSTRAVRHMTKKTGLRAKRNYMYLWKLFTVRESRLKMQTLLVQQLMVRRLKGRVLYLWMRVIDDRVIHSKYYKVRAIHAKATLRRSFFEWHKSYLVSYLASCKTAKASLRSWHSVTFWRKRQARLTQVAVIVHDRSLARKYLLFWLWEARRMLILRRRMTVRRMKSTVKKYLRWFRRWQWRVSVVVYSSKYHCYPHHKNSAVFAKYRALAKWRRFNKVHRQHKRRRKLTSHLAAWRRLTHIAKFAREAFTSRLAAFKRKHSLAYYFATLLSSCKELQTQRMWCNFVSLMQQSRVFDFWRRLYQQRMAEKLKVANSMRGIYKVQKFHMFRVWKVKVIHAYKINRILIKQDTMRRWTTLLAVRRHHRSHLKRSCFRAWRVYIYSLDLKVRVAQGIRRRVGALVYRKMRDHLLLTMLAFKRWRDRDASVHLWDFFKHAHLLLARHSVYGAQTADPSKGIPAGTVNAHKVAAAASLRASVQQHNMSVKIYEQLAHSQAGQMLVQDLDHSRQTRNSRLAPNSRVLELQANLQRRFSAADAKHHLPPGEVDTSRRPLPLNRGTDNNNKDRGRSHSPTHQPRAISPRHRHLSEGQGQPARATSAEPVGRGLHIQDLAETLASKGVKFKR